MVVYTTYIPTYEGSQKQLLIIYDSNSILSLSCMDEARNFKLQATQTKTTPAKPNPTNNGPEDVSPLVNQLTPSTPTHPSNPFHPPTQSHRENDGKTPWDGFSP